MGLVWSDAYRDVTLKFQESLRVREESLPGKGFH